MNLLRPSLEMLGALAFIAYIGFCVAYLFDDWGKDRLTELVGDNPFLIECKRIFEWVLLLSLLAFWLYAFFTGERRCPEDAPWECI